MTHLAAEPADTRVEPGKGIGGRGILVLGMHRSGTTAMARLLAAAGAHPGARLLGGSSGNPEGHWEDAFAVETHDRLLAALGRSWRDLPLPDNWRATRAAREAAAGVAHYIAGDRARHDPWLVKDPRLSLFADLWIDGARHADLSLSGVVMVRHPAEVAASLSARDGLPPAQGFHLWLEYTARALLSGARLGASVVAYEQLLADPLGVLERVAGAQSLAGALSPVPEARQAVPADLRHQVADPAIELPSAVGALWVRVLDWTDAGAIEASEVDALLSDLEAARDLGARLSASWMHERAQLWSRVARAEQGLAEGLSRLADLPLGLQSLGSRLDARERKLVDAVSVEIRRMQEVASDALASAARVSEAAEIGRGLAPRVDALAERLDARERQLVDAVSVEIRRMQEVAGDAVASAARASEAAEIGRGLAPRVEALAERVSAHHSDLLRAYTEDIRTMQVQVVRASSAAAAQAERAMAAEDALASSRSVAADLTGRLETVVRRFGRLQARMTRAAARDREQMLARIDQAEQAREAAFRNVDFLSTELESTRRELESALEAAEAQGREIERARERGRLLERILASRSWRLTRPLRALGRLARGEWPAREPSRDSLRPTSTAAVPQVRPPGLPLLPEPEPGTADVYLWAVIDWHFRIQRPQHIARALAQRGHRVFYISNEFIDAPAPGFQVESLAAGGRLFQVRLQIPGAPPIYHAMPEPAQDRALAGCLAALLAWTRSTRALSIVHHPYWATVASSLPNSNLVYDCMDHHAGFGNNADAVIEAESRLVGAADLVVVTSDYLHTELAAPAAAVAVVRNGCDYEAFAEPPPVVYRHPEGRKVIGYYGAIAEWFDPALVRAVASAEPAAEIVLVGADTVNVEAELSDLRNVRMVGEVSYVDLPYWLHGFDVCILPFRVVPLTLATNPVKVYEYLAAGKPVVSVALPEIAQFGQLVDACEDARSFAAAVSARLSEGDGGEGREARQSYAREQTWNARASALEASVRGIREPRVSVVVLCYNNWQYTEACLFSLEHYSDYQNLEILAVDNGSVDGTPERLRDWEQAASPSGHVRRVVLNGANLGFAAGNNRGLRQATGDYLVVLNNDTYVTPGWVRTMLAHFRRDPSLGLLGPVTNNIGNEARIEIAYPDIPGMIAAAAEHTRRYPGVEFPIETLAFFCVMMPRRAFEEIGDLDEAFGTGFFEDDDYCRRAALAGWRIACAEDVFVHHHLSASFEALDDENRRALFERNRAIYESKWGPWQPHSYRRGPAA